MAGAASTTCSTLSSSSSMRRSRIAMRSFSSSVPSPMSMMPSAFAMACGHEAGIRDGRQVDERDAAREPVVHAVRRVDREAALADPSRTGQRHEPHVVVGQEVDDRRQLALPADERRERRGQLDGAVHRGEGLVDRRRRTGEPLGEERREVAAHELGELLGVGVVRVRRPVVLPDAVEELREAGLALTALLDVHELRHLGAGEAVLVLQPRDVLAGRDPAVALAVEPEEDVALGEVRAVQLAGRMRARTELEHHGCEVELLDRRAHGPALRREFAQRGAHEHAQALVGGADRRIGRAHGTSLFLAASACKYP